MIAGRREYWGNGAEREDNRYEGPITARRR